MSLKQIYDFLVLIKEEWENEKDSNTKNIAINLSMEATLQFLRNRNYDAYKSLAYFALMPAGLSDESLYNLLGNQWEEYKQLLVSKSLIFRRWNVYENSDHVVYRIENNLIKMILKHYSKVDLQEWENQIIYSVSSKLIEIYKSFNKNDLNENSLFISLEGNIWDILNRFYNRMHHELDKTSSYKLTDNGFLEETSWMGSEEENEDIYLVINPKFKQFNSL